MRIIAGVLAFSSIASGVLAAPIAAESDRNLVQHAVFVMTNDADANEVIAYDRDQSGTLRKSRRYSTGGRGSGGTVDPLGSQGSLTLSEDGSSLFAANAGSGTVSVFRVQGSKLALTDRVPSGGSEPNAIAQRRNLVYVLNTAGSSSVVGFRLQKGRLERVENSLRFLSGNFVNSASLAFSADGRYLIVTERTTNSIDVFRVKADGTLSSILINPSVGPGAFSVAISPNGAVIVSETGAGGSNSSAISSYAIAPNGKLLPISVSVPTLGDANCWNVVTPDGRFVYSSNAGTSSIAGFRIAGSGVLSPLGSTIVGYNPPGSANLDITVSGDGQYLYSLNAASGAIGIFRIERDGLLTNLGALGGLSAGAGLNGIAAN